MKKIVLIMTSALMLAAFNFSIYQKEQLKANGETVFLALAPVDPRSLMQGDYMALRYGLENEQLSEGRQTGGLLVIELDDKKIGKFKRLHDATPLAANERLLRYHAKSGRVDVVPNSFMFQEGQANLYNGARYGVFKFDGAGKYILAGLADEALKVLGQ
jgi:uncharacterized membrane-anchored protein